MRFYYTHFDSPVGPLLAVAGEKGLALLEFSRQPASGALPVPEIRTIAARWQTRQPHEWIESAEILAPYRRQLEEYFAGERREFTLSLDLRGTEFQLRCWRALLEIPFGVTRSYSEQARLVGSPNGFRAVGAANGANPIVIIVPCHRVVASDGTLGGYGGGLAIKEKLLRLEAVVSGEQEDSGRAPLQSRLPLF